MDILWQSASEKDLDHYRVERSSDLINWTTLAKVPGSGNSQSLRQYSTVDTDPLPGMSYYRLRSNDLDGAFDYSEIRLVLISTDTEPFVYPNPVKDYVRINGQFDTNTQIEILSTLGQVIYPLQTYHVRSTEIEFSTEQLCSGSYFVRVISRDKVRTLPFKKLD